MNAKIRFFWLRDSNKNPVTLIAWSIQNSTEITFSTATRDPKDTFDRKFAHNKAMGRLMSSCEKEKSKVILDESIGVEASIIQKIIESFNVNNKRTKRKLYEAAQESFEFFKNKQLFKNLSNFSKTDASS